MTALKAHIIQQQMQIQKMPHTEEKPPEQKDLTTIDGCFSCLTCTARSLRTSKILTASSAGLINSVEKSTRSVDEDGRSFISATMNCNAQHLSGVSLDWADYSMIDCFSASLKGGTTDMMVVAGSFEGR